MNIKISNDKDKEAIRDYAARYGITIPKAVAQACRVATEVEAVKGQLVAYEFLAKLKYGKPIK